ncbi:MAG TPA: DUF72 domain-containing protein [Deltaproteobacteria bacterium]|jgi:uncharacterized protein YecE (DUF72 family)|nr:DUF72 domain-containing protein [Deltaproteobacteria bacterium]HQJ08409.1 DUF72 domain-containing protein [Deltaproteobacteria bacterium]
MHTYIGTSGWNYDHWRETFYPDALPKSRWLEFYSRIFTTIEVNATFYRQISETTFERWRESTPQGFIWAVKANRFITHIKKLKGVEGPLEKFFSQAGMLGEKLGPILFQLPPSLRFDRGTLEAFLSLLPGGNRYSIEARHESWASDDALSILRDNNIAWCISDTAGRFPYLEAITADFTYMRLHGSKKLYASLYTEEELTIWAEKIESWGIDGYVYFDNDFMGYAPRNALRLREILGGRG